MSMTPRSVPAPWTERGAGQIGSLRHDQRLQAAPNLRFSSNTLGVTRRGNGIAERERSGEPLSWKVCGVGTVARGGRRTLA